MGGYYINVNVKSDNAEAVRDAVAAAFKAEGFQLVQADAATEVVDNDDKLPDGDKSTMDFGAGADPETGGAKAWRDIWGAGQGTGQIRDIPATADLVARLGQEYQAARQRVLGSPGSA